MMYMKHLCLHKNPHPQVVVNVRQEKKIEELSYDDVSATTVRWQGIEEKLLAECYVAITKDPKVGRAQPGDTFWKRVKDESNKTNFQKRNKDMLTRKWKTLNHDCQKFNAIFNREQRLEKSGENELDNMKRLRETYRNEHKGAPFPHEEA